MIDITVILQIQNITILQKNPEIYFGGWSYKKAVNNNIKHNSEQSTKMSTFLRLPVYTAIIVYTPLLITDIIYSLVASNGSLCKQS